MSQSLKDKVKSSPLLKKWALAALMNDYNARPRWYIRWFVNPFVHRKHRSCHIAWSARLDVLPTNPFSVGAKSVIESNCVVNNGVGPVSIGNNTLVGIGNIIIGPVSIGNDVILAQHVVLSGLNHGYHDVSKPIRAQPVNTAPISVGDNSWLGAHVVVVAGVSIGRHCVVAAGSVVTKNIPDYSIAAGSPARVIKQYDKATNTWVKV